MAVSRRIPRLRDYTGETFGRLTVISFSHSSDSGRHWLCRCSCGATTTAISRNLNSGSTQSCGCIRREQLIARQTTHGAARRGLITPEYRTWYQMKERCLNEQNKDFGHYGGRGIKICERWLGANGFSNFLLDMGRKPSCQLKTIERRDNDRDYEPSNCYWASQMSQTQNSRRNRRITCQDRTLILAEWSRETGIPSSTIHGRIKRGWSPEMALGF